MIAQVVIFVCMFGVVSSHSFMISPASDGVEVKKKHCRMGPLATDKCSGPCIATSSWQYNSSAPVTTWKRACRYRVRWARNKHKHGFVRLSLVPVDDRDSFHAHASYAFHTTCFEVGQRKCNPKSYSCGTDSTMYETSVRAPRVPDGLYVLGWSWYGSYALGADGDVNFHFGDYYSCSYIRIEGGGKVSDERTRAEFKPRNARNRCKSLANTLGVCKVEPCPNAYRGVEPQWMCPKGMSWLKNKCRWDESEGESEEASTRASGGSNAGKRSNAAPKLQRKDEKTEKTGKNQRDIGTGAGAGAGARTLSGSGTGAGTGKSRYYGSSLTVAEITESASRGRDHDDAECSCRVRRSKAPYVAALLVARLDKNGRRESTKCLCSGDDVRLSDYPHGLTILARVVGAPPAVRFVVDGHTQRTDRTAPFSISGGDATDSYNPWRPALRRTLRIEACTRKSAYSVQVRCVNR